jgi:hypothetical protein
MKTLASTRTEAADCLFQTDGSLCGQPLRLEAQSLPKQDRPTLAVSENCDMFRHQPVLRFMTTASPMHGGRSKLEESSAEQFRQDPTQGPFENKKVKNPASKRQG